MMYKRQPTLEEIRDSIGGTIGKLSELPDEIFLNKDYEDYVFFEKAVKFMRIEKWAGVKVIKQEILNHGRWKDLDGSDLSVRMIAYAEREKIISEGKVRRNKFDTSKED